MPDPDRAGAAGTTGEEPAEAEVVAHQLEHAVAAEVAHDEPAARVEPRAPVDVRGSVEAEGVDEDTATAAAREQVNDRLRLAVAVQVAQADVLAGERRLGGRAELLARLPDRLVVENLPATQDLHAEVPELLEAEPAAPSTRA